jgi:hypothetical protein
MHLIIIIHLEATAFKENIIDDLKAPRFRLPLQNRTVPIGFELTLVCAVTGSPIPTINWTKNATIVTDPRADIKV